MTLKQCQLQFVFISFVRRRRIFIHKRSILIGPIVTRAKVFAVNGSKIRAVTMVYRATGSRPVWELLSFPKR